MKSIYFLPLLLIFTLPTLAQIQNEQGETLKTLKPPVKITGGTIAGKGDDRSAELEVRNESEKTISKLIINVIYKDGDGIIVRTVPHTEQRNIARNKKFTKEISSFFMKEGMVSVEGQVYNIKFKDDSSWPPAPDDIPEPTSNQPVSLRITGFIGTHEQARAVVACYNHKDKPVKGLSYRIHYLNANGDILGRTSYGSYGSQRNPLLQDNAAVTVTGGDGSPAGSTLARIKLYEVEYSDGSKWKPTP